MKRTLLILLSASLFASCASVDTVRNQNRRKLAHLSIGMTKAEVLDVMGTRTARFLRGMESVTNPHRTEMFTADERSVEVLFYQTDTKSRDDAVTDDELTPIILVDGKLAGWGWSFWNDRAQRIDVHR